MKKSVLTSSFLLAFASASAFAHHPAEDIVDPEIFAMIDENVSDTPHADLTFDDMGSDVEQSEAMMDAAEQGSEMAGGDAADISQEAGADLAAGADIDTAADDMIDTMAMLDSVVDQLAD